MLCPEVSNFPAPKVMSFSKKFQNINKVTDTFNMNNFYTSVIITCPDELNIPSFIEDCIVDSDSDFYTIADCPLTEFIQPVFVDKFLKNGSVYCHSVNTNCIVHNSAALTPDGVLTLHIIEYIYQTIGLEGIKRPFNFYEVKVNLRNINQREKLGKCLEKLGTFDFNLVWEPNAEDVCPSTIAKYFYERQIKVTVNSLKTQKVSPTVTEIPSVKDVELDEMTEWLGMLALGGELTSKETYVSTYNQPESNLSLKSTRISLFIAKGFITSTLVSNICRNLNDYVKCRELDNYWVSLSVQSAGSSFWRWNISSPRMFQAHDSSCTAFFTKDNQLLYSVGQVKYT